MYYTLLALSTPTYFTLHASVCNPGFVFSLKINAGEIIRSIFSENITQLFCFVKLGHTQESHVGNVKRNVYSPFKVSLCTVTGARRHRHRVHLSHDAPGRGLQLPVDSFHSHEAGLTLSRVNPEESHTESFLFF